MSELLGDTRDLHTSRVAFRAVITVTGSSASGHVPLTSLPGFRHLLSARASARIVSETLTCQVIGPASATKAVSCHVAVLPATCQVWPSSPPEILTIGGCAFVQHSLFVAPSVAPLAFAPEVAHQLKPTPVFGQPPEVVYHCTITGGAATDSAYICIIGDIEVDGIGFVQSWA